jgi:hypothetical protein
VTTSRTLEWCTIKFHVIQSVVEACNHVRKAEIQADAGNRGLLDRTRWMWLKNRLNWTEKEAQKWDSIGLGTVRDGHGLGDDAGASRHIRADECRGGKEAVPKLVSLGASDARVNRRTA